jgi:protein Tob/BTG
MSPTEFSNYIKQRAIQQQIHHHHHHHHHQAAPPSPTGRSLSPNTAVAAGQPPPDPTGYFFQPTGPYHPQFAHRNLFEAAAAATYMPELYPKFAAATASSYLDPASIGHQFYNGAAANISNPGGVQVSNSTASSTAPQDNGKQLLDGLNNFGLGSVTAYPPSPYQHLLVAN